MRRDTNLDTSNTVEQQNIREGEMDYHVNADLWNAVPADEQEQIVSILREAFDSDDLIVADPSVAPVTSETRFEPFLLDEILEGACKGICEVAAAAAIAKASVLSGPALVAALAAVAAAREACLNACD